MDRERRERLLHQAREQMAINPLRGLEELAVSNALRLISHVEEQIEKRQYLNAAGAANELTASLMSALSAVLKGS